MSDATILSPSGLNVLLGLAGALIGMAVAIVAVRARFVGVRTLTLEHDLRESLGRLERQPQEQAAIEEAINMQEIAVRRIRGYARRRRFFYRLLLGYLALMALAFAFVGLLFEGANGLGSASARWVVVGAGVAAAISGFLYALSMRTEISIESGALAFEPLRIPADLDAESQSEADLEPRVRQWLLSQGLEVRRAPIQSGFDLIGERSDEQILAEIKAVPRLTLEDVDAVAGAVARLHDGRKEKQRVQAVIVVPSEALKSISLALEAAQVLGIEVLVVDGQGSIRSAQDAALSSS
ncbi:MAG: hypothetical protein QOG36_1682 [Actinomycetota bacterium]|nr:hypothetical protein [Actinomycetota bacterium]